MQEKMEKNVILLAIATLITISIGGLVQLVPLYALDSTIEEVEGMRPYSPLELAGRNIYVREGCYLCHSQMIRPFRDEIERYGKYSNDWHTAHMINPRSVVPESIMPGYPFMATTELSYDDAAEHLKTLSIVGVPYTSEQVASAVADVKAQATGEGDVDAMLARYPKAAVGDFDGNPDKLTELDAMIAYLQMLGRLVDYTNYKPEMDYR